MLDIAPWPQFSDDEILAVEDVLKSEKVNFWTGDLCRQFEQKFADYTGRKYAIALANGSLALELALIAYNIGEGDEVIVTCRSFVASASCIIMRGATPVFADVDLNSQNICPTSVKAKITSKTKAIIAVHLAGLPCDMNALNEIATEHNLVLIEDCAQAHGASYKGKKAGSLGHIAAFSFCQDKIMTTAGEGGMLLTDDESIFKKCWSYKEHGKSYDLAFAKTHGTGFNWCIESFGTNWRMTELQAAVGLKQLEKLNSWVNKRRENAEKYNAAFKDISCVRLPDISHDIYHSYYKYYFFIISEKLKNGFTRDTFLKELESKGVMCGVGSCGELYLEKAFNDYYISKNNTPNEILPNARILSETSVMLTVHPTMTDKNIEDTINICLDVLKSAI